MPFDFVNVAAGLNLIKGALDTVVNAAKTGFESVRALETSMLELSRVSGQTGQSLQGLKVELDKIASSTGQSRTTLIELADATARLGLQGDKLLPFVETLNKISLALNVSGTEFASAFQEFQQFFGLATNEANNFANVIGRLSASSTATAHSLIEFNQSLAPIAAQFGLTIQQSTALAETFARLGVAPLQASSSIQRLLTAANQKTEEFSKVLGVSQGELEKLLSTDSFGLITKFADAFGKLTSSQQIFIRESLGLGDIRIGRSLAILANQTDNLRASLEKANNEFANGDSVNLQLAKTLDTVNSSADQLNNSIIAVLDQAISPFKDTVVGVLHTLRDLVDDVGPGVVGAFKNLVPYAQGAAAALKDFIDGANAFVNSKVGQLIAAGVDNIGISFKTVGGLLLNAAKDIADLVTTGGVQVETFTDKLQKQVDAVESNERALHGFSAAINILNDSLSKADSGTRDSFLQKAITDATQFSGKFQAAIDIAKRSSLSFVTELGRVNTDGGAIRAFQELAANGGEAVSKLFNEFVSNYEAELHAGGTRAEAAAKKLGTAVKEIFAQIPDTEKLHLDFTDADKSLTSLDVARNKIKEIGATTNTIGPSADKATVALGQLFLNIDNQAPPAAVAAIRAAVDSLSKDLGISAAQADKLVTNFAKFGVSADQIANTGIKEAFATLGKDAGTTFLDNIKGAIQFLHPENFAKNLINIGVDIPPEARKDATTEITNLLEQLQTVSTEKKIQFSVNIKNILDARDALKPITAELVAQTDYISKHEEGINHQIELEDSHLKGLKAITGVTGIEKDIATGIAAVELRRNQLVNDRQKVLDQEQKRLQALSNFEDEARRVEEQRVEGSAQLITLFEQEEQKINSQRDAILETAKTEEERNRTRKAAIDEILAVEKKITQEALTRARSDVANARQAVTDVNRSSADFLQNQRSILDPNKLRSSLSSVASEFINQFKKGINPADLSEGLSLFDQRVRKSIGESSQERAQLLSARNDAIAQGNAVLAQFDQQIAATRSKSDKKNLLEQRAQYQNQQQQAIQNLDSQISQVDGFLADADKSSKTLHDQVASAGEEGLAKFTKMAEQAERSAAALERIASAIERLVPPPAINNALEQRVADLQKNVNDKNKELQQAQVAAEEAFTIGQQRRADTAIAQKQAELAHLQEQLQDAERASAAAKTPSSKGDLLPTTAAATPIAPTKEAEKVPEQLSAAAAAMEKAGKDVSDRVDKANADTASTPTSQVNPATGEVVQSQLQQMQKAAAGNNPADALSGIQSTLADFVSTTQNISDALGNMSAHFEDLTAQETKLSANIDTLAGVLRDKIGYLANLAGENADRIGKLAKDVADVNVPGERQNAASGFPATIGNDAGGGVTGN